MSLLVLSSYVLLANKLYYYHYRSGNTVEFRLEKRQINNRRISVISKRSSNLTRKTVRNMKKRPLNDRQYNARTIMKVAP